ncbi:unnamed protein product [Mytilus coruscus]|uniref:Uncharacterized protein n=1 Tax=Mytilus coruscus TaxID=42192 RepID=A0A6J8ATC3_MYTCO|nr:unnamed protein product [Mytilus coruscus]
MPSSSNVSNRTYIISTQDEATSENIAPNDVVIELKRSASCCSAFNNDEQELELIIELENKDEIEVRPTISADTRDRRVRHKAAKGGRSITQILPTCVRELEKDVVNLMSIQSNSESNMSTKARLKAAKGVRTSMIIADGVLKVFPFPEKLCHLMTICLEQKCHSPLDHNLLFQQSKQLNRHI